MVASSVPKASGRLMIGQCRSGTGVSSPLGEGGDVLHRADQRFQRRRHRYRDARTPRDQQRRIADELQGVAKSLFGFEQDGLAGDRHLSQPALAGQGRLHALPAPFIGRKALAQPSHLQQGQGLVDVEVGAVRRQGLGAPEALECVVVPAQFAQRIAAIVPCIHVIRVEGEGAVVAAQRLLEAIERQQRIAAIVEGWDVARPQYQGAVEADQRLGRARELVEHEAVIGRRLRRAAFGLHHGGVELQGLAEVAARAAQLGEQVQRLDLAGLRLPAPRGTPPRPPRSRPAVCSRYAAMTCGGAGGLGLDLGMFGCGRIGRRPHHTASEPANRVRIQRRCFDEDRRGGQGPDDPCDLDGNVIEKLCASAVDAIMVHSI